MMWTHSQQIFVVYDYHISTERTRAKHCVFRYLPSSTKINKAFRELLGVMRSLEAFGKTFVKTR